MWQTVIFLFMCLFFCFNSLFCFLNLHCRSQWPPQMTVIWIAIRNHTLPIEWRRGEGRRYTYKSTHEKSVEQNLKLPKWVKAHGDWHEGFSGWSKLIKGIWLFLFSFTWPTTYCRLLYISWVYGLYPYTIQVFVALQNIRKHYFLLHKSTSKSFSSEEKC